MAFKYTIGQPFIYPKNSAELCRKLPEHVLCGALRGVQDQSRSRSTRSTRSSSCTPTMSRTPRPRRCGSPAPPEPTRSPASPPASPACGDRRMAAPTKRRWRCLPGIGTRRQYSRFHQTGEGQEQQVRLMGFGHRVYKNYDPRAKIMQKMCHAVLAEAAPRRRSDAEGRAGAGEDRAAAINISSIASSIRTSTSIRASP